MYKLIQSQTLNPVKIFSMEISESLNHFILTLSFEV